MTALEVMLYRTLKDAKVKLVQYYGRGITYPELQRDIDRALSEFERQKAEETPKANY